MSPSTRSLLVPTPRQLAALVALTALLSACGSTAQQRNAVDAARGSGTSRHEGLGVTQADGHDERPATASGTGSAPGPAPGRTGAGPGPASQPGGNRGTVAGLGATPGSAGAGHGRRGEGRGYTSTELGIGLSYLEGANEAFAALGAEALSVGDHRKMLQVMVDHVNAHSGVAGRELAPVWFTFNTFEDQNVQEQAACARWTQDQPVFSATGVTYGGGQESVLVPCLAQHDTPWLGGAGDERQWREFERWMYFPGTMNTTRQYRLLVAALDEQGFFAPGAKLGLITNGRTAERRAVEDGLKPALAGLGLQLEAEQEVQHVADAQVSNAVLRFKTAGVTHVFFAAPGGGAQVAFMRAAQTQQFFPRYALSTQDAPAAVQLLVDAEQLRDATGFGYLPALDVDSRTMPDPSQTTLDCLAIYEAAGMDTSSTLDQGYMAGFCDFFFLLRGSLEGTAEPSTTILQQRVDATGPFDTAVTFRSRMGAGRHDGASAYRHLRFTDNCECFAYTSGLLEAP